MCFAHAPNISNDRRGRQRWRSETAVRSSEMVGRGQPGGVCVVCRVSCKQVSINIVQG